MMTYIHLTKAAAITIGFFASSAAFAAGVPTTVTTNGPYGNNLSVINDGVFPTDYTPYNDPSSVYFGSGTNVGGDNTSFTFSFGGAYLINQIIATVDNNDDYIFSFFNGSQNVGSYAYTADMGNVTTGLQNFTANVGPFIATSATVSAANGDHIYGIGEVEFAGTAMTGAVPEPATWAMMLLGFGGLGYAMRRKKGGARVRFV